MGGRQGVAGSKAPRLRTAADPMGTTAVRMRPTLSGDDVAQCVKDQSRRPFDAAPQRRPERASGCGIGRREAEDHAHLAALREAACIEAANVEVGVSTALTTRLRSAASRSPNWRSELYEPLEQRTLADFRSAPHGRGCPILGGFLPRRQPRGGRMIDWGQYPRENGVGALDMLWRLIAMLPTGADAGTLRALDAEHWLTA